jgi:GTP-binding protein
VKPKYMAQMKSRPPTFVLLANRAEHLPDSYRAIWSTDCAKASTCPGVPIRLTIRQGANPYAEGEEGQPSRLAQARSKRAPRAREDGRHGLSGRAQAQARQTQASGAQAGPPRPGEARPAQAGCVRAPKPGGSRPRRGS